MRKSSWNAAQNFVQQFCSLFLPYLLVANSTAPEYLKIHVLTKIVDETFRLNPYVDTEGMVCTFVVAPNGSSPRDPDYPRHAAPIVKFTVFILNIMSFFVR